MNPTRGERNKNPGNIDRNGVKWKGMASDQTGDSRFIVFSDCVYGIRAIAKVLMTYSTLYPQDAPKDIDTVREIVNKWAPPVENDTGAYVNAVALEVGVNPDQAIDVTDPNVMQKLVRAIIHHENGRCIYPADAIAQAVEMALA